MLSRIFTYIPTTNSYQARRAAEAAEKLEREREQLEVAEQLDAWLASDVGGAFQKFVAADLQRTYQELAAIEPSQVEEVRTLQAKVFAIRSIQSYIARALRVIQKAQVAQEQKH